MATATEVTDIDLSNWAPGAKLYATDDSQYFVVDADLTDYPDAGNVRVTRRHTVILYTNEIGWPTDLTPDFTFDPGTTHEDAVVAAGYDLEV